MTSFRYTSKTLRLIAINEIKGLLQLTRGGKNILFLAIKENKDTFKFLLVWVTNNYGDSIIKKILSQKDENDEVLFHYAFDRLNLELLKFTFEIYKNNFTELEIREFFEAKVPEGYLFLKYCKYGKFLKEKSKIYSPFLHYWFELNNLLQDEYVEEIFIQKWFEMERKLTNEEIIKILLMKDSNAKEFLVLALKSYKIFTFIWEKVNDLFSHADRKKFLITKTGEFEQNYLLASIECENGISAFLFDVYCHNFLLDEFIHETDKNDRNLMHKIAQKMSLSTYDFAPHQFFQSQESNSENGTYSFIRILQTLQFTCEEVDMKKLLKKPSNHSYIPLEYALKNKLEVLKVFGVVYRKFFSRTEMKNLLEESSILKYMNQNENKEKLEFLNIISE